MKRACELLYSSWARCSLPQRRPSFQPGCSGSRGRLVWRDGGGSSLVNTSEVLLTCPFSDHRLIISLIQTYSRRPHHHLRRHRLRPLPPSRRRQRQAPHQPRRPLELLHRARIPHHAEPRPPRRPEQGQGTHQDLGIRHPVHVAAAEGMAARAHHVVVDMHRAGSVDVHAEHDQVFRVWGHQGECSGVRADVLCDCVYVGFVVFMVSSLSMSCTVL